MTHVLSYILSNIPAQMLDLAFKPRQFRSTVEQRIISQVIETQVLLDINLVGGKRKTIVISSNWAMPLDHVESYSIIGAGMEGSYYMIPPEARENRNISSVLGVSAFAGGAMYGAGMNLNGQNNGLNAMGLLNEMVGTHTMRNTAVMPEITLHGTNIIRFYPELLVDGLSISVMLEHDAEFTNMETSGIFALRNLCLCAVQRYIANNLIVPVDETEIVAGMEIGVIKTLVMEYKQEAEKYQELLIKLKGAMHADTQSIRRIMYHAL
jgi:hypothetical protein